MSKKILSIGEQILRRLKEDVHRLDQTKRIELIKAILKAMEEQGYNTKQILENLLKETQQKKRFH